MVGGAGGEHRRDTEAKREESREEGREGKV